LKGGISFISLLRPVVYKPSGFNGKIGTYNLIPEKQGAKVDLPIFGRSTGSPREVMKTFFTRKANIKGLKSSPIHQEAKNLYRELSTAMGVQKQGH